MKCQYWYSKCLTDAEVYSIRCRSKKKAEREIKELNHHRWGPLVLVKVEAKSMFDLISEALSEGGLYAESKAHYDAKGE